MSQLNLHSNKLILGHDPLNSDVNIINISNPNNDPNLPMVKVNGVVPYSSNNPPPDHPAHEGGDFSTMYIENPKTTNHDNAIEFTQPNGTQNLTITGKENGVMTYGFANDATTIEMFKGGLTVKDGALTCQGGTQIQLGGNTTSTNYSRITQPAGTDGLTLATPTGGSLLLDSAGDVEIKSASSAPEVKIKINSTNQLSVSPNSVVLSAEGVGNINYLCNETKIKYQNNDATSTANEATIMVGDSSNNTPDLSFRTQSTGVFAFKNNQDVSTLTIKSNEIESNTDITPSSTFLNIVSTTNPFDGSTINYGTSELKLMRDVLMFHQTWHYAVAIPQSAQASSASGSILFNGTTDLFTQYYAGIKTDNGSGGAVQAPLLGVQHTSGTLVFEFFDSNSTTTSTPPSDKSTNLLNFPANGTAGVSSDGYLGLKAICPFIMPPLNATSAVGSDASFTNNLNLMFNNRAGTWNNGNITIKYNALTQANGSFNFTLDMPSTPAMTATNFAYVYITYSPSYDLRQLE